MLCFRRPVYVGLAISSINSLHYFNPRHRVTLYLDAVCLQEFGRQKSRLDYKDYVRGVLIEDDPAAPWQLTKLRLVLLSASQGIPFVDADSRWHLDPAPLLDPDCVTYLVEVNRLRNVPAECALVERGLGRPEWKDLRHYNTGFVSIPGKYCSEEFKGECHSLARQILDFSLTEGVRAEEGRLLRHVCEELALSLAAQIAIGPDNIRTLKAEDGPGNRRVIESFYYGALHGIT